VIAVKIDHDFRFLDEGHQESLTFSEGIFVGVFRRKRPIGVFDPGSDASLMGLIGEASGNSDGSACQDFADEIAEGFLHLSRFVSMESDEEKHGRTGLR